MLSGGKLHERNVRRSKSGRLQHPGPVPGGSRDVQSEPTRLLLVRAEGVPGAESPAEVGRPAVCNTTTGTGARTRRSSAPRRGPCDTGGDRDVQRGRDVLVHAEAVPGAGELPSRQRGLQHDDRGMLVHPEAVQHAGELRSGGDRDVQPGERELARTRRRRATRRGAAEVGSSGTCVTRLTGRARTRRSSGNKSGELRHGGDRDVQRGRELLVHAEDVPGAGELPDGGRDVQPRERELLVHAEDVHLAGHVRGWAGDVQPRMTDRARTRRSDVCQPVNGGRFAVPPGGLRSEQR